MSSGPICHIPPDNTPANPQPINLPGLPGPITVNTSGGGSNLQSTLNNMAALLNAMRQMLLALSGQRGVQGPQGQQGQQGRSGSSKPARWIEDSRVTETVRVFQNNDKSSQNWVDVEQINSLTMKDGVTGESWRWSRDH